MMQCTANLLFPYLRNHGLLVIKAISSQHQISIACFPACEKKWATLPLLRSLVRSSHIHSKTACRGFKSFCPCQKSQVSLLRYLTFSLVCGRIWQRGAAAGPPAVRVVGACSPVGCVQARPRRQPRQVRPLIFS